MSTVTVKRLEVGQLKANCYLLIDNKTKETIVVDPGDDSDYIQQALLKDDLIPVKIIATHGHFDHIMAVTDLKINMGIPFYVNEEDVFLLKYANKSLNHFTGNNSYIPYSKPDYYLKDNQYINYGESKVRVLFTPGHTPGGVALYSKESNFMIVGDLVFEDGFLGRTDFSYANSETLIKSLKKIMKYPDNTVVYSGHGSKTTIKDIKRSLKQ